MANTFTTTQFVSRAAGPFIVNNSYLMKYSYKGVNEFSRGPMGYASGRTIDIKIPGVPTTQLGLAIVAEDIVDRIIPYTLTPIDIYNIGRDIDFQSVGLEVVGNEKALSAESLFKKGELSFEGKNLVDNYVRPACESLVSSVEQVIAKKLNAAAWYCPFSLPTDMQGITSYSDTAQVKQWMDQLGFQKRDRVLLMNNRDYTRVTTSMQNMYNPIINSGITETGNYIQDTLSGFTFLDNNTIAPTDASPQYIANNDSTGVLVSSMSLDGSQITLSGVIVAATLVLNKGTLISLPVSKPINQNTKLSYQNTLVVVVKEDALGNNDGTVTFTVSEPLISTTEQANINIIPGNGDPAFIWPAHQNNYAIIPMGIVANTVKLADLVSTQQSTYTSDDGLSITSYIQGLAISGVNTYRLSMQVPTLAIPHYCVAFPSPL